jgi:hypothetical protein
MNLFGTWWSVEATRRLPEAHRLLICDWLRAHNVDPDHVRAVEIRELRVHIYEYKINDRGDHYLDPEHPTRAAERHYTVPLRSKPPRLTDAI